MAKIGKTQSITRQFNNEYVLALLKERPYSGTELASILSLSNATISSILRSLLSAGVIRQHETTSEFAKGRKRVTYVLNSEFGYVLSVVIANYSAVISLADINGNILNQEQLEVLKYDDEGIQRIVATSASLVSSLPDPNSLRDIIISLPGRVNAKTGELELSTQFDPDLFKEKKYIQKQFAKAFGDLPIYVGNDINLSCLGEMRKGQLKDVDNAIYISIDTGIGGALLINGKLFEGDFGFAGEFGLVKTSDGNRFTCLDVLSSLRSLKNKAIAITGKEDLRVRNLGSVFAENEAFKAEVLSSADALGEGLLDLVQILDIGKIVISGRVRNFGEEYLERVKKVLSAYIYGLDVSFSSIPNPEVEGSITAGIDYLLNKIAEETRYDY